MLTIADKFNHLAQLNVPPNDQEYNNIGILLQRQISMIGGTAKRLKLLLQTTPPPLRVPIKRLRLVHLRSMSAVM